jgi:hypothetical protein
MDDLDSRSSDRGQSDVPEPDLTTTARTLQGGTARKEVAIRRPTERDLQAGSVHKNTPGHVGLTKVFILSSPRSLFRLTIGERSP